MSRAGGIRTHLIWAAVVHPVLPVTVEAAGTSEKMRNKSFKDILDSERAAECLWGEFKRSQSLMMRLLCHAPIPNNPKGQTLLRGGEC